MIDVLLIIALAAAKVAAWLIPALGIGAAAGAAMGKA